MKTSLSLVVLWVAILGLGLAEVSCAQALSNPPAQAGSPAPGGDVGGGDIRDIRGPEHIPYSWLWILYTAAGLTAVGLLYVAWRAWRNRRPVKVKLPHEIALERLMAAVALMIPGQAKEFSIAVSDAVRGYIEARFQARAPRCTTEEFLHDLLAHEGSPLAAHSGALEDFLKHCDLAKFAKGSLSVPEMQSMHDSARRFVEETRPVEGKVAVAKSPTGVLSPKKGT